MGKRKKLGSGKSWSLYAWRDGDRAGVSLYMKGRSSGGRWEKKATYMGEMNIFTKMGGAKRVDIEDTISPHSKSMAGLADKVWKETMENGT